MKTQIHQLQLIINQLSIKPQNLSSTNLSLKVFLISLYLKIRIHNTTFVT